MATFLQPAQVPGLYRRNVGSFRVATVHDGMLDTAFRDVIGIEPEVWEAMHRAAFRPVPPQLACNTFVIEDDARLMLVDAGCGATTPGAGQQVANLRALGITPNDVDVVLMTHLHRDHAAGLVDERGQAVFPRAELVVHRDDLDFWRNETTLGRLRDGQKQDFHIAAAVLSAYADRIRSVGGGDVVAGVSAIPTPGHTPGHTAWLLDSEGDRLLIWGDVVHLPIIQFAYPEVGVVYDFDSSKAAAARLRVLDMVAAERIPVAGVHLDFPCFGRVEARSAARGVFSYTSEVWTSNVQGTRSITW